jgi:D-arginine utilization repressor
MNTLNTLNSVFLKSLSCTGYVAVATAIEMLLHPYAEVVLHNIATNRIELILNAFSKRFVGDDSLLNEQELVLIHSQTTQDVLGPYSKTNWDGRTLKSISSILRAVDGKPVALLCINVDVSQFEQASNLLQRFLTPANSTPQPAALFKEDWQERINEWVQQYLQESSTTLTVLTRSEKRVLVQRLEKEGAFKAKNAAVYVGRVLKISRATVYNYLSE